MLDDENFRYIGKNKIIYLSKSENILLKLFIDNKNNLVKYKKICELFDVEYDNCPNFNFIYVIICRLNKKLKGEFIIRAKNGLGYILEV